MTDRRSFLSGVALSVVAPRLAAQALPTGKIPRIGLIGLVPHTGDPYVEAFTRGLHERGYVEGRNLLIEFADAGARLDRLPELAAELVRHQVEVIVVFGPAPLEAARNATKTIPLVMVASSSDPVAEGIAVSLARPGGNVTGLTYAVSSDRFQKQLQLLKSGAGRISRVAVLWDFDVGIFRRYWAPALADASRVLGMSIQEPVRVRETQELPAAFAQMKQQRADALLVASSGPIFQARAQVSQLALQHLLPAISAFKEFPQVGLLMSYGPDFPDVYRRAAGYVDRIVNGAKPGDLPIELPTKYEFAINLKTAKSLGITIPQSLLVRADEVIE